MLILALCMLRIYRFCSLHLINDRCSVLLIIQPGSLRYHGMTIANNWMYFDVYFKHCTVRFSIPFHPQRRTGLRLCISTWVFPPNTFLNTLCSFHSQNPSFQDMSYQQVLCQVVTRAVNYCDIQLLFQRLPSRKVPYWGKGGHSIPPLIG